MEKTARFCLTGELTVPDLVPCYLFGDELWTCDSEPCKTNNYLVAVAILQAAGKA